MARGEEGPLIHSGFLSFAALRSRARSQEYAFKIADSEMQGASQPREVQNYA